MLGYVRLYSPRAKETIRGILEKHLDRYQVTRYTDNILTCVDELVKNGIKANYKYVLIREKLEQLIAEGKINQSADEILKDRKTYSDVTEEHINLEDITKVVREALTQEAKVITLKSKANKEERKYTDEERQKILDLKTLLNLQKKTKKYKARVELRINEYWNALNIEVMNNAPILERDLGRLHQKRKEFKEFADRGEEMMFFINNMDTQDAGAGLGYATIDSGLREMGLDPFQTINIISVSNTTVLIYFKLDKLKELMAEQPSAAE